MSQTLSSTPPPAVDGLFAGYAPTVGRFDEMFASIGQIRPHWQRFADALGLLGQEELTRRWEQAQRLVYENGVSYAAYGDPRDQLRPWELDPLPLLVSANEWRSLSEALVQRARLLNLILADLYGPQRLLIEGLLPPDAAFNHPGYLRAYHGQRVPGDCYLQMYAADLARSPDGQWWVVADRSEAPAGAGYALENRIVISRTFPAIFHDCQVERLASYFMMLRETLHRLAPAHSDNPRIVLLTHGPGTPNYFEDAYLSRYLGYTLVESGDLAVRHNRVLLKTLGGLLPVDVILRRLDDAECDPLELHGDPALGVAGLMQAARAGTVAVANALGSGLVESPIFQAYLPSVCLALLGEELKLPSVATWWCGEEAPRQYVLEHLDELVIKPAFRRGPATPIYAAQLSTADRAALADQIRAHPGRYVAQEQVVRSCAPVWSRSGWKAKHVALRTYLVAAGGGYAVMQGGLSRVAAAPAPLDLSVAAGDGSKDVWILSEGPVHPLSLLQPANQPVELRRSGAELPSRVADHLYWLGRQAERAEGAGRLLRTILVRLTSESDAASLAEMPALLRCLAEEGQIEPGFVVEGIREQLPEIEQVLPTTVFDDQQPGSLRSTLTAMYRAASVVRDRLSMDSWRIINRVDREFRPPQRRGGADLSDVLARLNQLLIDLAAFAGLVMESMTQGQGWRFLDLGRRLERAQHTIGLVQNALVRLSDNESPVLEAVLEVADSSMTYRSRYLSNLQLAPVLDLLLTDETNPRSLAFQLVALARHVECLPRDPGQPLRSPEQRLSMSALNTIRMVEVDVLCELHRDGQRTHLERLLARLAAQLPKLSDAISHKYLIHAGPLRQLADVGAAEHH